MKLTPFVFVASLVVNLAFVALLVSHLSSDPAASPATALGSSVSPARPVASPTASGEVWSRVESENLSDQRDRLKAEGFPPSLVRAILAAEIGERFAGRRKALEAAQANTPFWKNVGLDPKIQADARALAREEQKTLRDLLGPDLENGYASTLRGQLPNLALDKIEQLVAIRERFDNLRQDFSASLRGGPGPVLQEEREKMNSFETAMHAELATVLTPAELEDYDLRLSNVATQLKYDLTAFDASEEEFRTLYRLQTAFNERNPPIYGQYTPEQSRARSEAQKQYLEEIKTALGAERYTEYERGIDYDYRRTTQLVARLELPPATANMMYALQKEYQARLPTLAGDRNLTPEQRNQILVEVGSEVQARATAILGEKGFAVYKTNGGSWLQNFQPRPPPTPPPARN